jgi:hypothetical protein
MDVTRAHATALAAALVPLDYQTFQGDVTGPDSELRFPYLVVWTPPAGLAGINLHGTAHTATTMIQVTAVGQTTDEVLAALDRVAASVVGRALPIPGRTCTRVQQVAASGPPRTDPSVRTPDGQPTRFGWITLSFASMPAGS